MKNKKNIAKALIVATTMTNIPVDSLANTIDEYRVENSIENKIKNIFARIFGPIDNQMSNRKDKIIVNRNIIEGKVLEITLGDDDFVPDLSGNPEGYETIRVTTTGDKKLVKEDYDNLRLSGIPKIDLSNAYSDVIPEGAFSDATHLVEFKFPIGVKTIESGHYISETSSVTGAFSNCTGLTGSLTIPNTVTSIGDYAFYSCTGLTGDLVVPDTTISIGDYAFYDCSGFKGNLVIPYGVTSIGYRTFMSCRGFTGSLTIPDSVTSIGEYCFYGCRNFNALSISNSITTIRQSTFANCSGFRGNLVIPNSVTSIGVWAFMSCRGFTGDLVIPDSVKSISTWGFLDCTGFKGNLILGNSLEHIGQYAFDDCSGLTGKLVIPDSVKTIDYNAFRNCNGFTGDVIIPNTVTTINDDAFSGCNSIEKIVIKIDETNSGTNYKQNMISSLPIDKTYIEMPYDFDISGTWLETSNYMTSKSMLSAYGGSFENNEGMGVILKTITSPFKTIRITKDGVDYPLEANKYGDYVFNEVGDYNIYIETELGTISNMSFRNNTPVLEPTLEFNNNTVNIVDNGVLCNDFVEEFNNPNNLKFSFSNPSWTIENGVLKSETIGNSSFTENEFTVNAKAGDKLQIVVNTSSESGYDYGYIYFNGAEVYKKSGTTNDFQALTLDLQEGENTIKFKYTKDGSSSHGDDVIVIDYIKMFKNETSIMDSDILEYRINGGEWQQYTDAFELNYPNGTKVQIDVIAKYDGFISSVLSQEIIIGGEDALIIEEAITIAEESKDPIDISNARSLINAMPESEKKNQLQARLNAISPRTTISPSSASANVEIYIKSENMLSLSLDTNSITFDDFGGTENLEKANAVNLTVNSSLPYKVDAYLATEIQNANKDKRMNKEILNIKANDTDEYKTFADIGTTPITLLDSQEAGKDKTHGIDIMLKGGISYEKDTYKTTIKFEATQK